MLLSPEEIDTIAAQSPQEFYDRFLKKSEDNPQKYTSLNSFGNATAVNDPSGPLPVTMTTLAFEVVDGRLTYYPSQVLATSRALVEILESEREASQ